MLGRLHRLKKLRGILEALTCLGSVLYLHSIQYSCHLQYSTALQESHLICVMFTSKHWHFLHYTCVMLSSTGIFFKFDVFSTTTTTTTTKMTNWILRTDGLLKWNMHRHATTVPPNHILSHTSCCGSSSSWCTLLFTMRPEDVTVSWEASCKINKQTNNYQSKHRVAFLSNIFIQMNAELVEKIVSRRRHHSNYCSNKLKTQGICMQMKSTQEPIDYSSLCLMLWKTQNKRVVEQWTCHVTHNRATWVSVLNSHCCLFG